MTEEGIVSFKLIKATDLPSNMLGIKSKAFVEMRIGSWVRNSEVISVGSKGSWTGPLTTPDLPVSHLEREGVKIKIVCQGMAGDTVLGQGLLPMTPLLNTPGEWVDVKGQLSLDGKHTGKYALCGIYAQRGSKVYEDLRTGRTVGEATNKQSTTMETAVPAHTSHPTTMAARES